MKCYEKTNSISPLAKTLFLFRVQFCHGGSETCTGVMLEFPAFLGRSDGWPHNYSQILSPLL